MPIFVVQEHHSKRLHWDFRLEVGGVFKSWAIPKGPSMDPSQKHLALAVPDHDLEHADYEGIIPEGEYGAGPVITWDKGEYEPVEPVDPEKGFEKGNLTFRLKGKLLRGEFAVVKMRKPGLEKQWLLIKKNDSYAKPGWKIPIQLTPERKKKLKVKPPPCNVKD